MDFSSASTVRGISFGWIHCLVSLLFWFYSHFAQCFDSSVFRRLLISVRLPRVQHLINLLIYIKDDMNMTFNYPYQYLFSLAVFMSNYFLSARTFITVCLVVNTDTGTYNLWTIKWMTPEPQEASSHHHHQSSYWYILYSPQCVMCQLVIHSVVVTCKADTGWKMNFNLVHKSHPTYW